MWHPQSRSTIYLLKGLYVKLRKLDSEIATILDFLTTEPRIEPDDIIEKADRVAYLARKRKRLVAMARGLHGLKL